MKRRLKSGSTVRKKEMIIHLIWIKRTPPSPSFSLSPLSLSLSFPFPLITSLLLACGRVAWMGRTNKHDPSQKRSGFRPPGCTARNKQPHSPAPESSRFTEQMVTRAHVHPLLRDKPCALCPRLCASPNRPGATTPMILQVVTMGGEAQRS